MFGRIEYGREEIEPAKEGADSRWASPYDTFELTSSVGGGSSQWLFE
jgi:hypothetical protein